MMRITNVSHVFYAYNGRWGGLQTFTTSYHLPYKPDVDFVAACYRDDMKYGVRVFLIQRGLSRDEVLQETLPYLVCHDHDVQYRCIIARAQDGRLSWDKKYLEWAPELCSQIDDIFQSGWERK